MNTVDYIIDQSIKAGEADYQLLARLEAEATLSESLGFNPDPEVVDTIESIYEVWEADHILNLRDQEFQERFYENLEVQS